MQAVQFPFKRGTFSNVTLWTFAQTAGLATVLIMRKKKVNTMHHNSQYEEGRKETDRQTDRQRQRKTDRQIDRQTDRELELENFNAQCPVLAILQTQINTTMPQTNIISTTKQERERERERERDV